MMCTDHKGRTQITNDHNQITLSAAADFRETGFKTALLLVLFPVSPVPFIANLEAVPETCEKVTVNSATGIYLGLIRLYSLPPHNSWYAHTTYQIQLC